MDVSRGHGRGRGHDPAGRGRPHSRNRQWISPTSGSDAERGRSRRGRGIRRGAFGNVERPQVVNEPQLESMDEREAFYQELVKAREVERQQAIANGLMDDPNARKSLGDAITIVGTCMDMCPRFERYRRERENNLMYWEQIPGTKRVDHSRAVKIYERAAGDKSLPSDIRPPEVLKHTLNYLFHELLPREGQNPSEPSTLPFIRDRSRAVRNDFVLQRNAGPIAMECHERCARFHIFSLHIGKGDAMQEVQQLMNTLQTLKEYYIDQRDKYIFHHELEMRIYHRLTNMRDQVERRDVVPPHILNHPVYNLATRFREHVQKKSAPITKTSPLVVDQDGMAIFAELASVLRDQGNVVMIFLTACILEFVFGKDTIEDIDTLRGGLSNSEIIDGISEATEYDEEDEGPEISEVPSPSPAAPLPLPEPTPAPPAWPSVQNSAFANLASTSAFSGAPVFGQPVSAFGNPTSAFPTASAFAKVETTPQVNGETKTNPFASPPSNPFAALKQSEETPTSNFFSTPAASNPFTQIPPKESEEKPVPNFFAANQNSTASNPFTQTRPTAEEKPISNVFTPQTQAGNSVPSFPTKETAPNFFSKPTEMTAQPPPPPPQQSPIPDFFANKEPSKPLSSPFTNQTNAPPVSSTNPFAPSTSASMSFVAPQPQQTQPSVSFLMPTPTPSPAPAPPLSVSTTELNPSAPPFIPLSASSKAIAPEAGPSNLVAEAVVGPNPPISSTTSTILFSQPGNEKTKTFVPSLSPTPILPTTSPLPHIDTEVDAPAAPRIEPISLPGTPTVSNSFNPFTSIPSPSLPSISASTSIFASSPTKKKVRTPIITSSLPNTSTSEILSPLILHSPTVSRSGSMRGFGSPSASFVIPSSISSPTTISSTATIEEIPSPPSPTPSSLPLNGRDKGKGKGKEKARSALGTSMILADSLYDDDDEANPRVNGSSPPRHSPPESPEAAEQRKKKEQDRAYREACQAADEYSEKVDALRSLTVTPERKKRIPSVVDSPGSNGSLSVGQRKKRKRVSRPSGDFASPRTDEELAKRLTQNHEEHVRRWAPGSFLRLLRQHIERLSQHSLSLSRSGFSSCRIPRPWKIWLSLNPEIDATAIWLERKFDMPDSGSWLGEPVFSISANPNPGDDGSEQSPGILIFECTSLEGIVDELDRKYRVLDDCTRLRDTVATFSPRRHYIPALFVVHWAEEGKNVPGSDFVDMINKLVTQSAITSYCVFSITATTKDLDTKFSEALAQLDIDVEGRLVRVLNLRGVFKLFEDSFTGFVQEWIEKCTVMDVFEWSLYGKFLQAVVDLLNFMARSVMLLVSSPNTHDCLPPFEAQEVSDSDVAYDVVMHWLSHPSLGSIADTVTIDLNSQQEMGKAFPTQTFVEQLYDLVQHQTEVRLSATPKTAFHISTSEIATSAERFQSAVRSVQSKLGLTWSMSIRRSPKRRSMSELSDTSVSENKRRRLSPSISTSPERSSTSVLSTPMMNGRSSPSPSDSTISLPQTDSPPVVTIAMLRALTQNLKQRYGGFKS